MKAARIITAVSAVLVLSAPAVGLAHGEGHHKGDKKMAKQSEHAEKKFAKFDRDGDGVVRRDEWRGSAESFDRLDRNRDGVITPAEAHQTWNQKMQKRFRGMDRNRDGIITREEWRWNDTAFRNHDRNRDGVLSGKELRGRGHVSRR